MAIAFLNHKGIELLDEYCAKHGKFAVPIDTDITTQIFEDIGVYFNDSPQKQAYDEQVEKCADGILRSAIHRANNALRDRKPSTLTEASYSVIVGIEIGTTLEHAKEAIKSNLEESQIVENSNADYFLDKVREKLNQYASAAISNQFNRAYQLQQQISPTISR